MADSVCYAALWDFLQEAVRRTSLTADQLMAELPIEALDRREWPATEAEIRMYFASLFAAQALARVLTDIPREEKLAETCRHVSQMTPEPPDQAVESLPLGTRSQNDPDGYAGFSRPETARYTGLSDAVVDRDAYSHT